MLGGIQSGVSFYYNDDGEPIYLIDPRTGLPVGAVSSTWTEMVSDLDPADYVGVPLWCSDRHSNTTLTGGSLWTGSATGFFQLLSDPIVFTNLSDAPNPVTYPGLRIRPGNLSHQIFESNGAHYRSVDRSILLDNIISDVAHAGAALTDEYVYRSVTIPRDVNGNSLLQNGDYIEVQRMFLQKTGTTDKINRGYAFGHTSDNTETELYVLTDSSAANTARGDFKMAVERRSNTTLRFKGASQGAPIFEGLVIAHASAVTVDEIDHASNDSYFMMSGKIVPTTSLVDTALTLMDWEVMYVRGY